MNKNASRIGFMQGRLSPLIDGRIQAFPWPYWEAEFPLAAATGLSCMEWTLDHERIFENPLMSAHGRTAIRQLATEYGVSIPSLTADCCMQAPFWKATGNEQAERIAIFQQVLLACADLEISLIVVPLVDNGSLKNAAEQSVLENIMLEFEPLLRAYHLIIAFESDFPPEQLQSFISGLPAGAFGINYDIGNSASLGWNAEDEIRLLAPRIVNVHVKDRILGGTTVPLGEGAADFPKIFDLLYAANYGGRYILQTARAAGGAHAETIRNYGAFVAGLIGGCDGS